MRDPAAGGLGGANIAAWLEARAVAHPDRPAIISGAGRRRRSVSFRELADGAARVGTILRQRGVAPGARVLLVVPMSIDLYTGLLGVLHAGGVAVFVDAWADRGRLEQAVAAADPAAFIGTPQAQLLRLLSPALRRVPVRLWAGAGPLRLARNRGRAAARAEAAAVAPEAPALVTFTTGTTGQPKAAARSHAFLGAQHVVLARHLGLREDDVDMPTLPIFVLNNLAMGVTSVIPSFDPRRPADIDPAAILAQMRAEGVTTTSGSPAFYARLAEAVEAEVAEGGAATKIPVRALYTGGAPVFPPLARRLLRATAGDVHVLYGSTEAEPIAGIRAAELVSAAEDPNGSPVGSVDAGPWGVCAGEPVPEIDWKLIHPTDGPISAAPDWSELEVPPGRTGELVVTGGHVLTGYLGDPAAEALNKVRDGDGRVWHRTGDAARFDGRRLWLMGRVSQRVERAGETWWSMAAEARALAVPGVAHAAYLEWPGGSGRAVLCVEVEDGAAATTTELRDALAPVPVDQVRRMAIPRDPRHASKTDTGRLRELLDD